MTVTRNSADHSAPTRELTSEPYLIVSADGHAGPQPSRFLRQYCPPKFLQEFDEYCREQDQHAKAHEQIIAEARTRLDNNPTVRDLSYDLYWKCRNCAGQHDPHVRLRDMDADGIATEVIFAGGQNDTELPWVGSGFNAGPAGNSRVMRAESFHMWNQWIADYVSVAPERLLGVMQIPIWDVDAAIREVEWCANVGLRVVNLAAPRDDYQPYTDLIYEPFWAACESAGATLTTHAGASAPYSADTRQLNPLSLTEVHWFGNRGLTQLIFGGVFERYPALKFVLTEQRVDFAPMMVKHLDSVYDNMTGADELASADPRGGIFSPVWSSITGDPSDPDPLTSPQRPSTYWRDHCYLSGSFLAPFEVALRHEVGLGNLMWGSDYPHAEGTWPDTRLALRNTFATVPEYEARMILGENAIDVYHLDRDALRKIANRIGPRPEELMVPLKAEEYPRLRSWAFRQEGNFT